MHSITVLLALLTASTAAQDLTKLCTVSPTGCTIGPTACPTGCIKSARCQNPCPPQKTTVVTYTDRQTTTKTSTKTLFSTKTVTATRSPVCEKQIPYINLFSWANENCSTSVQPEYDPLCLFKMPPPKVNFTFASPVNKLNTPTIRQMPGSDRLYRATNCTKLAVPNSRSALFYIDGLAGTNATEADCHLVLYANSDCTGFADVYNPDKANICQNHDPEYPAWNSAQFECSLFFGYPN